MYVRENLISPMYKYLHVIIIIFFYKMSKGTECTLLQVHLPVCANIPADNERSH